MPISTAPEARRLVLLPLGPILATLVVAVSALAAAAEPGVGEASSPLAVGAGSPLVRIGLETDLQRLTVPCCEPLWIEHGGERRAVTGGLEVTPGGRARQPTFKLQAAAVKDEDQAHALAAALERRTGAPARATFDVASGLYRVRLGRFETRDAAERSRQRFAEHGLAESWVVAEGGGLEHAALAVSAAGESREAAGRWVSIEPQFQASVRLERGRFRGRLLVYLNDRGLLNLVNELPLEHYLRGVVPVEMGPELYDQLESLKAQAVAARTFAVRGLGGFGAEGFDLCASPRCQAYGGMGAEHPLSDRAVAETAGEIVLHDGAIVEALYSASCGGRTEDVEIVFPKKSGLYLRGVTCPERGTVRLAGTNSAGGGFAHGVLDLLAPPGGEAGRRSAPAATTLEARVAALLRAAGMPGPDDAPASLDRAEVRRYLASVLDLAVDARVLRPTLVEAEEGWSADELRLHARLAGAGLGGEAAEIVEVAEIDEIALEVARLLGVVAEERAYFLERDAGTIAVREGARRRELPLSQPVATFARRQGELVAAPLDLAPGDRLRLVWSGDRLLAVASDREGAAAPPRPAETWTVWKGESELRRAVKTLYPGFALRDLEIVSRGGSGRIGKLRLLGDAGDTVLLEGLAVRWTMGTPETWFDARREMRQGQRGWLLEGRGRGHGVGLCQLGAVAMARRGHTYKEILAHYYTGAKLGRIRAHDPARAAERLPPSAPPPSVSAAPPTVRSVPARRAAADREARRG
ncbi:MAG TPA: SpoIID/LytB domain-containing protein [Thermoanaerobaculia bacterium]|nr:SpoIID/LytB domain-containing protein [Thermoanaerobaculia bacterium]